MVLHTWFRHPDDFRAALLEVVRCGGDTDTTAALLGGIVGARVGRAGIPAQWLAGLCEWPRSVAWMEQPALRLPALGPGLRNLLFPALVLLHGLRRLLPPY